MQGTTSKNTPDATGMLEGLTPEELLREGVQYFRAREYRLARECFERYLEAQPSDAHVCHQLARVYYHENANFDRARACIARAIELDPGNTSYYLETLAEILIHTGDYAGAREALEEAVEKDPGNDAKHTYALDFYLNLIRRKGGPAGKAAPSRDAGYSAKKDRRHRTPWRHLFIPASILVHLLVLVLMNYISEIDIRPKETLVEELAYFDVDVTPEAAWEEAGTGEFSQEAGPESAAPAAEEAGPRPGGPERAASKAGVSQGGPELPSEGPRSLSTAKAQAGLEAVSAEAAAPAPRTSERSVSIGRPGMEEVRPDVQFSPRPLGIEAGSGEGGQRAEAAARTLSERSGGTAAGVEGAELAESGSAGREGFASGGKASSSLMVAVHDGSAPGLKGGSDKPVTIDRPHAAGTGAEAGDNAMPRPGASRLDISATGTGRQGEPGGPSESFGSVERGGLKAAAGTGSQGVGGDRAERPGLPSGGGKVSGKIGVSGGPEGTAPEFRATAERQARLGAGTHPRGGEYAGAAAPGPAARDLGISAAVTGGASSPAHKGAAGKPGHAGPAGLGERRASAPGVSAGRSAAAGVTAGSTRGYKGAPGAGKPSGRGGLLSGGSETGGPSLSGGEKEGAALTTGRGKAAASGTGQLAEAGPGGPGSLDDLLKGTEQGGGKGNASGPGGGKGEGVALASGEKAGARPSGTGGAGTSGSGRKGLAPGGKREAEGALGVPGGLSKDKYASAAKTRSAPIAPEKLPGVQAGSKGGAGAFGPTVKILTPAPGSTTQVGQVVTGMVSDPRITKATLTLNNDSRVVSVGKGRFEAVVALREGRNVITVMAFDENGSAGKDSVSISLNPSAGSVPIEITEPRDGQVFDVSRSNTVNIRGTVGDPSINRARMILNGRPKDIVVKNGSFSQEAALTQEQNSVMVEAMDASGRASSSRPVGFTTINIKPKDIIIILTWDKPNADFDLHVYDPLGSHTSYKSPNIYESNEAIAGAQLEQDAKGNFGPEVFTMEKSEKGVYSIKSNYYYSGGDGDAHATVTVVLYGDNPARRIVRVFGPHLQVDTKTGEETWDVARFKMPEGIFLED